MDSFEDSYSQTGNLHHAYIIEGERESIYERLLKFIEKKLDYEIHANPDFFHEQYDSFSIDDARKLREMQNTKALSGDRKIYVIETLGMTVEAQNSLLKVFEEPSVGTHFFIISPSAEVYLPTLRSRVIVITHSEQQKQSEESKRFLVASIKERLELVGEIAEEKDKGRAISLTENLLGYFYSAKKSKNTKDFDSFLKELLKTRIYLGDRSPSLKLLLEHIALTTPHSI